MDQDHAATTYAEATDDAEAGNDDSHALLKAILEQGKRTFEMVHSLVRLLMPKEGGREGPPLEELLAQIISQQRELIKTSTAIQTDLQGLAESLPNAVAEAVRDRVKVGPLSRS